MATGYTISPLDSNESILEKLNKVEKYLKDNPLCNLYISSRSFYAGGSMSYNEILNSPLRNNINTGDLILFSSGVICMVTAVNIDNDIIYYDDTNAVVIKDGNNYVTNIEVLNPTPTTAQIRIDIEGATSIFSNTFNVGGGGSGLVFKNLTWSGDSYPTSPTDIDNLLQTLSLSDYTDCNGIILTSSIGTQYILYKDVYAVFEDNGDEIKAFSFYNPSMDIGYQFNYINDVYSEGLFLKKIYDYSISSIIASENAGNVTIEITDAAGNTQTSNAFAVGGNESVYVIEDSQDNKTAISTSLAIQNVPIGEYSICLGDNTKAQGNNSIVIGRDCVVTAQSSIAIGYDCNSKGSHSYLIGLGVKEFTSNNNNDSSSNIGIGDTLIFRGTTQSIIIGDYRVFEDCNYGISIGFQSNMSHTITNKSDFIAIGKDAECEANSSIQLGEGTNIIDNSIQYKTHQIVAEENSVLKLSNELQLNNHLITIISMTNNFATASANRIQVTTDQDDSAHEQVQNLNHPTSDTSILNDEMVLALYNYTDMTDPNNPISEFTLCYAAFMNYDSVNNVCDCMLIQLAPSYTM